MDLIQNVNILQLSKGSKGKLYKSVSGVGKALLLFEQGGNRSTIALNTDQPNPLYFSTVTASPTLYNELGNTAVMVDPTSAKLVAGQDFRQVSAFRRDDDYGIAVISPTTLEPTFITVAGDVVSVGADELILMFERWSLGYMDGDAFKVQLLAPRPKSDPIPVNTNGIA